MIPKSIGNQLPLTIDEAVTMILNDLRLLDRTRLSAMEPGEVLSRAVACGWHCAFYAIQICFFKDRTQRVAQS